MGAEAVKGGALRLDGWWREAPAARDGVPDRSMCVSGHGRQRVGRRCALQH